MLWQNQSYPLPFDRKYRKYPYLSCTVKENLKQIGCLGNVWKYVQNDVRERKIRVFATLQEKLWNWLAWRFNHKHYKSKFEKVWVYFRLIIMKNQLKSIQIKAWRTFDSVSTGLPWRISYNQCESKSTNQSFTGFEYTSDWLLWRIR